MSCARVGGELEGLQRDACGLASGACVCVGVCGDYVRGCAQSTNAGSLPGPSSYVTAAGGADAAMCGTTSIGLSMIESVQLFDVQATAMPQYQNDGVVTAVNCIAGTSANLFMASAAYVTVLQPVGGCRLTHSTPDYCVVAIALQVQLLRVAGQLLGLDLPQR